MGEPYITLFFLYTFCTQIVFLFHAKPWITGPLLSESFEPNFNSLTAHVSILTIFSNSFMSTNLNTKSASFLLLHPYLTMYAVKNFFSPPTHPPNKKKTWIIKVHSTYKKLDDSHPCSSSSDMSRKSVFDYSNMHARSCSLFHLVSFSPNLETLTVLYDY